ncbi:hypothetical protein [Phyllobacterium phragmitis]|uniref:hypothetical protein n=1 Tax=Phyllobacterium phragmitis TaxID=2670329 RepID=UPI001304D4C8|nr:hypothetical protein [Phyllobacterium phragmitis]
MSAFGGASVTVADGADLAADLALAAGFATGFAAALTDVLAAADAAVAFAATFAPGDLAAGLLAVLPVVFGPVVVAFALGFAPEATDGVAAFADAAAPAFASEAGTSGEYGKARADDAAAVRASPDAEKRLIKDPRRQPRTNATAINMAN